MTATQINPGPFGIDTPDYSDRDREMFVLGYEFAEACRRLRDVATATVHRANVGRILAHLGASRYRLESTVTDLAEGWCRIDVRRRDS